jgi:hypothetical protein
LSDVALNLLLNDQRVDPTLLQQLVRAEVRESDSDPTVISLRFKMVQQPTGEIFPLDDDLFVPAASLDFDLAAPGGLPERLFSGKVTHIRPHFETIESNCYVEVLGMDAAAVMDVEDRAIAYPDATESDAARQIFQRNGITANVTETPAKHLDDHQLLVQRESDWRFLRRMARRNGFVCFLEHDPSAGEVVAYFGPPKVDANPQADLVMLRDGTNLLWFDIQREMVAPVRHAGAAIDPIAKRIVRSTDDPISTTLGADDAAAATEDQLSQQGVDEATALLRDPTPLDAAIRQAGSAATDRDRFLLEARGELDPELYRGLLRARRPVLVKGVGKAMAGVWYARAVRTTLHDAKLSQTFTFTRNATGPTGGEQFGQSAEEVPPQ